MLAEKTRRKADSNSYNRSSEDFIPIACHYDKHTLLTKNGELIQTIQISGINSEKISKDLFSLRAMVRKAIKETADSHDFAFWVHTIRRKDNLDDNTPYNNMLSANIHDLWRKKNYWHDKFVNKLYISIIHDAPALKLRNFNSLVNSFSSKTISSFEEKFFVRACEKLNNTVNSILEKLEEYGAEKLGIRIEKDLCYSDPMFLYRRIMQLNEDECLTPISDLSIPLASHKYAVGSDKIEVIGDSGKKFAAMMSIKEYQEVSSEALDRFLQIPVEMIATEVFYFANRKEVVPVFEDQNYLLGVSGDSELKGTKGIDKIVDEADENNKFCHQQISFMVIGDDLKHLDNMVYKASETLSNIGIVHVREDINLEKAFWAQLPANFSFLSRMSPTILDNTAALASLHNFPTGNQYNPWGRAITLLRTEKGTPYFMNFHDNENNGNSCIFGPQKSGKTTLLNFLISEADKYTPTTIYLTGDTDSEIFIKAKGGKWIKRKTKIINPLLLEESKEAKKFLLEFFKIIANHHIDPLDDDELTLLKKVSKSILKIPMADRKLSEVIKTIKTTTKSGKALNKRLKIYLKGGKYYQVFEREQALNLNEGDIVAFSLKAFDDAEFTKKHYPKEKKLVEQFEYDLDTMRSIKAAITFSTQFLLNQAGNNPRIMAIDNIVEVINPQCFSTVIKKIMSNVESVNGVFTATANIEKLQELYDKKITQKWLQMINTRFILPPELKINNVDKILKLASAEFKKLSTMTISSRTFLIQQDGKAIASELSIGGLPGITKILSAGKLEHEIYNKIIEKYGKKTKDWVAPLYEEFESTH